MSERWCISPGEKSPNDSDSQLSDDEKREKANKIREKYAGFSDDNLPEHIKLELEILENLKAHFAYELVSSKKDKGMQSPNFSGISFPTAIGQYL